MWTRRPRSRAAVYQPGSIAESLLDLAWRTAFRLARPLPIRDRYEKSGLGTYRASPCFS